MVEKLAKNGNYFKTNKKLLDSGLNHDLIAIHLINYSNSVQFFPIVAEKTLNNNKFKSHFLYHTQKSVHLLNLHNLLNFQHTCYDHL